MTRVRIALLVVLLLPVLEAQDGFVDLFPTGDLSDWVEEFHPRVRERAAQEDLKAFSIKDGVLHCDGSVGNVGFIRHKKKYCDFDLRVEFRAPAGANTGICFRAPPYDRPTPAHTGFELQLWLADIDDPDHQTGALYSVTPSLTKLVLAPKQWHNARVLASGPKIRAWIDGVLVQDFDQSAHEDTTYRESR